MAIIESVGRWIVRQTRNPRYEEYKHALFYLRESNKILDVGCGTGTFLELRPNDIVGIDLNPDNVAYCRKKGLIAYTGDALNIPFADDTFDGVHCSHVMQVLPPNQAAQLVRELGRVVKNDGIVVIVTLNNFKRFYRHPENARPYPPDAIRRYFASQGGVVSPMYPDIPLMEQEEIWLRRTPLIEFYSSTNHMLARISLVLNRIQYSLFLRKYWGYDSYSVKLRKLR